MFGHRFGGRRGSPGGRALVICNVLAILLAGCSDGDTAQSEPEGTALVEGGFESLPLVEQSDEAGPRTESDGTVAQSFTVEGMSPELVLEFYENELTSWEAAGREDVGDAMREEFLHPDGRRLEVSAIVFSEGSSDSNQTVQYSLVLHG